MICYWNHREKILEGSLTKITGITVKYSFNRQFKSAFTIIHKETQK